MLHRRLDLARLAAFIDGEGHIGVKKSHGYLQLRLRIANTDKKLMVWLRRFGGTVHTQKPGPRERRCYAWHVANAVAADLLRDCLPYFVMKRKLAELGLELRTTVVARGTNILPLYMKRKRARIAARMKRLTCRVPYSA